MRVETEFDVWVCEEGGEIYITPFDPAGCHISRLKKNDLAVVQPIHDEINDGTDYGDRENATHLKCSVIMYDPRR